jgi:hypothetical protein
MKKSKKTKSTVRGMLKPPVPKDLKGPGHYVPQFWIRGFSGLNNRVLGRMRGETQAKQVKVSEIMAGQDTYTVFDKDWQASDQLEDMFANKHESRVAPLFRMLQNPSEPLTEEIRLQLCHAVAVAVCRLPHVMKRGFRLGNGLVARLAGISAAASFESFRTDLAEHFGTEIPISEEEFDYFRGLTEDQLAAKIALFVQRIPQDPVVPEQETLLAVPNVAAIVADMDLTLLGAPAESFILGDNPLPDSEIGLRFTLPLSASLALAGSRRSADRPAFARRPATREEISTINQTQFDNSVEIVVGANRAVLEAF